MLLKKAVTKMPFVEYWNITGYAKLPEYIKPFENYHRK
jgi:hypothetical protein